MATSLLPRWAPTPSQSQPRWGPSAATVTGELEPPEPPAAEVESAMGSSRGIHSEFYDIDHREGRPEDAAPYGSVCITWEDVWVTAVDGRATILHGVSGSARPGQVLAIMGPSGCGKTTLLDTLAGRLDKNLRSKGDIRINGQRQRLTFGTSAYVTQENMLMATLTVREAIYYSAQIQLSDTMLLDDKLARADEAIQEMGLTSALETRIGGRNTKGISGGQRKRLSICLEILTRPRLLFLDEPTSGLDSAASFHVMNRIADLAAREGMTIVAVVHQPCNEVFEIFHGLCLLASGQTIYFGPATNANEFFASNGYPCPPMRNPSDHFLRTINRDFELESGERTISSKPSPADEAIEVLVNAYKSSNTSENAKKEMHDINETGGVMIRRNQASFVTKVFVLTRRSFVNMYRDVGYYWLRLGIYISISLCLGTIYYNFGYGYDSIRSRSSMLMFTSGLLTLMAIGGFPSFVEEMKIFRRERLNGHYDFLMGIITGAGIQVIMLLNCGFFKIPSKLPKIVWKYPMFYISFQKYALQGFYKNEFLGLVFQNNTGVGEKTITGEQVITKFFETEMGHSKWVDFAILCGMIVIYRLLFVVIIKVVDMLKPISKGESFRCPAHCICGMEKPCTRL
ncbi:ABC transporter G family member 1-like isoform X2 [Triticum urartu]|uniref:ABC transporter G family member 1-like isoform X2 n=1 Tax=Triticum urartu TaxID=4572 RepID=UPI0020439107|nr:ABC transporter G family member 1-like isoform X2 [Triticum urartu]